MKLLRNYYADGDKEDWYFPYRKDAYTNYTMGLRKSYFDSCKFTNLMLIRKLSPYRERYPQ